MFNYWLSSSYYATIRRADHTSSGRFKHTEKNGSFFCGCGHSSCLVMNLMFTHRTYCNFLHTQGLILDPLLINLQMLLLGQTIKDNKMSYHSYADDTQIDLVLSLNNFGPLQSLCQCVDQINIWMF